MPDMEISIRHPNQRQWVVQVGDQNLQIAPAAALMDDDPAKPGKWWDWGTSAFNEILPPGSGVRNSWDTGIKQSLTSGGTAIARIAARGDQTPFAWFWESMIGTVICPDGVFQGYSLGRSPGPIDIVRAVFPTGDGGPHALPQIARPWRVMVVRIDSDDRITKATQEVQNFIHSASQFGLAALEFAGAISYDGNHSVAVGQSLAEADVVEIIAHGVNDKLDQVRTQTGQIPWKPLLNLVGRIGRVKVVLLSWCFSDFFRIDAERPAETLLNAGVPAVVAWKPKPWLQSLLPFQRGFYGALLNGAHVARACSIGRAAIFNALFHDDPGKWLEAGGPRLYVRNEVSQSLNIGRLRAPLR
jgi:hypothetical protein